MGALDDDANTGQAQYMTIDQTPSIAMQLVDPGDISTDRLNRAEASDVTLLAAEVRIDVNACAVCRTDLQLVSGDLPAQKLPIVPGHQVVGVISEVGADIDRSRIGQAVGVSWFGGSCGHCSWCLEGRENLCEQAEFTGWQRDGGYTDSMIARSDCAFELPADIRPDLSGTDRAAAIAPLLCGGVIGYRSLRVAGVGEDSAGLRLGLYGYGASATLVAQLAKFWGVETYVVTRSETEVERARRAGATWAGTYEVALPTKLDAAITFAPSGDVVVAALKALERGGTVTINAIHLDRIPQFNYDDLWWERSLKSVANVTPSDVRAFLALVGPAGIQTMHEELPLAMANTALRRLNAGDVAGSLVLTT